ncbi:BnaC01g10540D [Brassica napus]|uniref:BnaC01g10540D protein n=1 Tax=Brassica napus TaxID=3708 RepID=A0A078I0W6_BRANA|nr:BnaC01g10540D [Brassica napus]
MESLRLLKLSETTLGGSGVALHYANLIVVMEKMIKQPQLVGLNAKDDLCSMLPATVRSSLSSRLKGVGFRANALHYAAVTGVPVDSQSESGTPLIWDAGHDLLNHNVDPNAETEDNVTPLLSAVAAGSMAAGSMACLELLVKAGAKANVFAGGATQLLISLQKQRGKAHKQKQDDKTHSIFPSTLTHKSYLLLKRSLCWLRLGQVEHALSDAKVCRELKPDWPKECFREGAALRLLQRFDKAANAFYERVNQGDH